MTDQTKEAFTAGPWHTGCFVDADSKCQCTSILDENHAGGIATVHLWNNITSISAGGNDAPKREEAVANAHLIAAAPDLYEALKMVADADSDCCADGLSTIPQAARAKIDAALAKARGES